MLTEAFWVVLVLLCLALLYFSVRYAWWRPATSYDYPRILMYHMIRDSIPKAKFNGLRVLPSMFERQLQFLTENDWSFYTVTELYELAEKGEVPSKSVAITFDDGYEDNFINAFPLIKKYNAKATIYLVVDRHDRDWSGKRKEKNQGAGLLLEPKLSDAQVKEMLASGLIEIGSHTLTHDNLVSLDALAKRKEIQESRDKIRSEFGIDCEAFCYPFGLYEPEDVEIAKEAGYKTATTVSSGIDSELIDKPFELSRITISGKDSFYAFSQKMRMGKRGLFK